MDKIDIFVKIYPTNKPKQTCLNRRIGKFNSPFERVKKDIVKT